MFSCPENRLCPAQRLFLTPSEWEVCCWDGLQGTVFFCLSPLNDNRFTSSLLYGFSQTFLFFCLSHTSLCSVSWEEGKTLMNCFVSKFISLQQRQECLEYGFLHNVIS